MAKFTVKCTKKSSGMTPKALAKGAAVVGFNLQDNGDDTFTVFGVDAAGNQADISALAKLTATSDTLAAVTVDPPTGMSSAIHAAVPAPAVGATAIITLVATWNDGSIGPFTIAWPITITSSPIGGVTVTPGTPTSH